MSNISLHASNEIIDKLSGIPEKDLIKFIILNYGPDVIDQTPLPELFNSFTDWDFIQYICTNFRSRIFEELDLDDPILTHITEDN